MNNRDWTLTGCNPGPWQPIGDYKSDHAAICAMASRCDDYEWLKVISPSGRLVAEYRKAGL